MSNKTNGAKSALSIQKLLPIIVIITGFSAFIFSGGLDFLSFETLSEHRVEILNWCESNMVLAVFTFIVVYTIVTALSIPGAVWITLSGGFIFGFLQGVIYVVIAATSGAVLIFLAARYAFADYFHAKAGPAVTRMEDGFRKNALSYLLFLRLVPVFPFWLVNLVPALLGVQLRTYIIGTFFGIIPGSLVFTWVGSGLGAVLDRGEMPNIGIIFEPVVLFPIIGLSLLSIAPVLYKRFRASHSENL